MADRRATDHTGGLDRRGFFGVAGGGALIATIGGRELAVRGPADVARADEAAAAVRRPARVRRDPLDSARFQTPAPQPGGRAREYWIGVRAVRWNVTPRRRDERTATALRGRQAFTALVYQRYSAGFASRVGPATMPGPLLEAEVGDTIVVHFRNPGGRIRQAVTMHPHGVRYTPDYDGSYLGDFTRVGGFVAPGEEFTYTWEATPDSVGVWPYHDHGPNGMMNAMRGLVGAIVVRPRGAPRPDVERVLMLHMLPREITGLPRSYECVNGRSFAGNTPTIRARVGQSVALHVIGAGAEFHTFHVHGHRWRDSGGAFVDSPTVGPFGSLTAAFTEDNPGRWLYHCHVGPHEDAGMAGWYLVSP